MADNALDALNAAWWTSVIAITLLTGALAIVPYWDKSIYLEALHEALATPAV